MSANLEVFLGSGTILAALTTTLVMVGEAELDIMAPTTESTFMYATARSVS
jgi:hypothetical protein